jgi:hypothetical protein
MSVSVSGASAPAAPSPSPKRRGRPGPGRPGPGFGAEGPEPLLSIWPLALATQLEPNATESVTEIRKVAY